MIKLSTKTAQELFGELSSEFFMIILDVLDPVAKEIFADNGEILALVTAPSYDPGILVGRQRSKNYTQLYRDSIAKPLYDRGLLAEYPPGSPFKILTGLIALQEGVVDEQTTFFCNGGFSYGRGRFQKCHCKSFGPLQLHNGIYKSCNAYFSNAYLKTIGKYAKPAISVDIWSNHVKSFGLGQFMGYDLPTGKKGNIPDSKTYKKVYPNGGWRGTTIISNAIGQGEVLMTPIQLANMMATVANEGYYYTPHIIKRIEGHKIDEKFTTKHVTTIDKKHFKPMISGLFDVYNLGTASALRVDGITICGKTGNKRIASACICLFVSLRFICVSLRNFANANDVAAFANSDGCMVKLPIAYQQRCPAIVFPNKNSPASVSRDIPNIIVAYFS